MLFVAREGSRELQALEPQQRADVINNLANMLLDHQSEIIAANKKDLDEARSKGETNKHYHQYNQGKPAKSAVPFRLPVVLLSSC